MRAVPASLLALHICTATIPIIAKVSNSSWSSSVLPTEAHAPQVASFTSSRPLNSSTWVNDEFGNMTYPFDHDEFFRRLSIPKSSPKGSRPASKRIEHGEAALATLKASILRLYGATEKEMTQDVLWFDGKGKDRRLVDRLLRCVVLEEKFVVAVGGMSDTAGHGNRATDAYPAVFLEAAKGAFAAAGVELVVRNFAMGGVPSFPNSVCMQDFFGADVDLIVWDFRMVEHDDVKGELYIRQALQMPKSPMVMFKRENRYLPTMTKAAPAYAEMAGLHALDETPLFNKLHQTSDEVKADKFCRTACSCPGQVRWHAGWKMQRLRGLQMAMVYGRVLSKALSEFKQLAAEGKDLWGKVRDPTASRDWTLPRAPIDALPPLRSKSLSPAFADHSFKCALSWSPHLGRDLSSLIDTSSLAKGGTGWKIKDPNKKISDKGKDCGYIDDKKELEGTVDDGWVFFALKGVAQGGTVGFCADIPDGKNKRLTNYEIVVLLNGEEVQDDMTFWLDSRTLGIAIQCYGTTKMVRGGENNLGFRIMQKGITLKLTHVIWR